MSKLDDLFYARGVQDATTPQPTVVRLAELLRRAGKPLPDAVPFGAIRLGELDSLVTLDLLVSAEKEFEVQIDTEALLAAGAFDTLGTLAEFVDRLRAR